MSGREMSLPSLLNAPSKPILKKRSHSEIILTTLSGKTHGNLLTRAAQAVQEERRREIEEQEFREQQRKNPLTLIHVLRSQQRITRKGSISASLSSLSSSGGQSPAASKRIHFNDRVEQCIVIDIQGDEDQNTAMDDEDESEDEGLFMMKPRRHVTKSQYSTIGKLPANNTQTRERTNSQTNPRCP